MKVYIVAVLSGGILNEVMPFKHKDEAIKEFLHQAEHSGIAKDENEENFLDEEKGLAYWTDGEADDEVHLQTRDLIDNSDKTQYRCPDCKGYAETKRNRVRCPYCGSLNLERKAKNGSWIKTDQAEPTEVTT